MEVLTHVNKRIKNQPQIKLPVEALMSQYENASLPPLVRNFCIIYLEMAVVRYGHGLAFCETCETL